MATAASVQVNVNAEPKLCARILADLRSDQITKMTMGQLCRYDFLERHAGRLFRQLDWQPVSGDPVALTMKIYDANIQRATNPGGIASQTRHRNAILDYAQEQARHHALHVEATPFKVQNANIPGSGAVPDKGYMVRSRGSYCGMADNMSDNPAGSNAAGRILIALFTDRALQHPVLDIGTDRVTKNFPVLVDRADMVIGLWTNWLHYHGFDPTGSGENYSADIESKGFMHNDNDPTQPVVAYSHTVCAYTVYIKNGVK